MGSVTGGMEEWLQENQLVVIKCKHWAIKCINATINLEYILVVYSISSSWEDIMCVVVSAAWHNVVKCWPWRRSFQAYTSHKKCIASSNNSVSIGFYSQLDWSWWLLFTQSQPIPWLWTGNIYVKQYWMICITVHVVTKVLLNINKVKVSLVPRHRPAFHCLQYGKVMERWAGPGNEANFY